MDTETTAPFGTSLRGYRLAAGLTQERLAEQAGVSARTIRALEGNTNRPLKDTVQRLATALHLHAERRDAFLAAGVPTPRRSLKGVVDGQPHQGDSGPLPQPSTTPGHYLPLQLTSFVGRVRELEEVARLLMRGRLLTLSGPGGVGKTRLVLEALAAVRGHYPQGAWVVELAPVSDPSLVPQVLAIALGVVPDGGRPLLDTLVDVLRPKALLLVLDNCEHLLDSCALLVERLLRACPNVHILTTSRERLGLVGETVLSLLPLGVPADDPRPSMDTLAQSEAVQLFVERVRAAQPQFALSADNAAAVAQICVRLDGLPLALELAAAQTRGLGTTNLARRLDERFGLLTGGHRTALPRYQTLGAMVDWSYDLLREPEKAVFTRLTVFSGGFTLDAAEVVCDSAGVAAKEVPALLARLVDKSLIQVNELGGGTRYQLLETLRHYGWERLGERGARAAVQDRHATYYGTLARQAEAQMRGPRQIAWLDRLDAEMDNIRAALSWYLDDAEAPDGDMRRPQKSGAQCERAAAGLEMAADLRWFWLWRAHRWEGRHWLEQALACTQGSTLARARAMAAAGYIAFCMDEDARGRELMAQGVVLLRDLGATRDLAEALSQLGMGMRGSWSDHPRNPDDGQGTALQAEAVALARLTGDPWTLALALGMMALSVDLRHDDERHRARTLAEDSLRLFQQLQEAQGVSLAHEALGAIALYEGDHARAGAAFAFEVAALRTFGDVAGVALGLSYQGTVAHAEGDDDHAAACFEQSLALYRNISFDRARMANVLRQLGEIAFDRGQYDLAQAHLVESLKRAQEADVPGAVAAAIEDLAGLAAAQGSPQRALRLAGAAAGLRVRTLQPLSPEREATLVRRLVPARDALSPQLQKVLWREGRALLAEQAIAEAGR